MGGSIVAAFLLLPGLGSLVSHWFDRMRNGADRDDELKARAKFYRNQIASQLGISPDRVGAHEFRMAARINPQLGAAYRDVIRTEARENRDSALINTGVAAASFIPGMGGVGKIASEVANGTKAAGTGIQALKMTAGGITGGAIGALFHKDHVSAQDAIEAIGNDMQRAQEQGIDLRQVVTPRMVFMIRLAQDENMAAAVEKTYGKPFHKLSPQEQDLVMYQSPQLTAAVTSEAHAVATGVLPLQELMATKPNLDSSAARYAPTRAASFTEAEVQRRALASEQMAGQAV